MLPLRHNRSEPQAAISAGQESSDETTSPQNPTQFVEPEPRFHVVRVRGVRLHACGQLSPASAGLSSPLGGARLWRNNMESSMSRATILALSLVAALALSSGAMAQGGGAGGAGSGAGGASGAAGTTSNSSGSRSSTSGNSVAQPPGGQSSPTGNTAAQPPGSTGQNSINSPGTGVGPGSSPGSTR